MLRLETLALFWIAYTAYTSKSSLHTSCGKTWLVVHGKPHGTEMFTLVKRNVYGIPALIVLNPVSTVLRFTLTVAAIVLDVDTRR